MNYRALAVLMIVALSCAGAWAGEKTSSLADILTQQKQIRADMDAGRIEGITKRQVNSIRRSQQEVFAVTEGKSSVDEMSINEKIRLENALERINAEFKGGDRAANDDRDHCRVAQRAGSKMKVQVCGTDEEHDQAREQARNYMEKTRVCEGVCG